MAECHLPLSRGRKPAPGQTNAAVHRFFKSGRCLAPDASKECGASIDSHTISRSTALGAIAEAGHVSRLRVLGQAEPTVEKVGWRSASTFRGFCSRHDNALFAPLEKTAFVATPEQCMLLAYRSVCFELFLKQAVVNSAPETRRMLQTGVPKAQQKRAARAILPFEHASELGLRDLIARKAELDADVAGMRNRVLRHLVMRFAGEPIVAFSGGFVPDADLDGVPLQNYRDETRHLEPIVLNMIPGPNESVLLISWRRSSNVGIRFVDGLVNALPETLAEWAPQLGFLFLDNTYFSQQWWDTRRKYVRRHLIHLAGTWGPTESNHTFLDRNVSGWNLTGLELIPDR